MTPETSPLEIRLATDPADLLAAQRLRYRVFVEELGGDGALVDPPLDASPDTTTEA